MQGCLWATGARSSKNTQAVGTFTHTKAGSKKSNIPNTSPIMEETSALAAHYFDRGPTWGDTSGYMDTWIHEQQQY